MTHVSIRQQLAIIVGLSLLPIALLGYLFVAQSNKEIAFAQKEDRGVAYIEALLPDLTALAGGQTSLPANPALDGARAELDEQMASDAQSAAYFGARDTDPVAARSAATALLSRIGDTSNLILDPDLDSYYVMDILVLKLPAAINSAADLLIAFEQGVTGTQDVEAVRIDLLSRLRIFGDLITGTDASLAAAIDGNADGGVEPALGPALAAYENAANAYVSAAEAALEAYSADPASLDLAAVAAEEARFSAAALTFGQAVGTEMSRLLQNRVAGFDARLWMLLAVSVGLVILVFGYSIFAATRIVRSLSRLEHTIRDFADGNEAQGLASAEGKDEVSAIVRAVAYLRTQTVARQQQAAETRLAEQAAIDDERRAIESERAAEAEAKAALAVEQGQAIAELKQALLRFAGGNLDSKIETVFPGDMDEIRSAYNETVRRFADIVTQLRTTSHGVKTATGEILAGTNDLSERTTKQAATIEETSAAMEQLAQTVADNARKAKDATEQTDTASRLASEGGTVMEEANTAMERITQSSTKISNIIGMIDDIAFQTNLLALNASVEAARAGEAGKGFAVVAVEVRRLAQSAAEASSEVKTLIEQSAGEVTSGTRLVADASDRLSILLQTVQSFSTLMTEIARESGEQAGAIAEVTTAVRQMDEMTQHNAALVEETNAAIEQTEAQASQLDEIVDIFRLSGTAGAAMSVPAVAAGGQRGGAKGLQDTVASAAKSYFGEENAAVKKDWSEF